jgi:MFS family permease
MSQNINLKEIERKSWTSYFQDGFYDIFMGLLMLGMGLNLLVDANDWYIAVLWLVGLLILIIGRRLITIPRVGRVKFGPERRIKQKKVVIVLMISLIVGLALSFIPLSGVEPSKIVVAAVAGVWIILIFSLVAYFMDFRRLYAYGLLFAISMALANALDDLIPTILFFASGSIALLVGLVVLIRLIRKYPKTANGLHLEGGTNHNT